MLNRKTTGFPSFVWDRSASRRVRRLRPKTRLAGAGEALSYPARRPWAGDDPEVFSKRLRRMGGGLPPTTPYTRVAEGGPRKSDVEPGQLPARRVAHVNAHTRVLHDMC